MVYSKRYGNANLNYTVISFPEPIFNWTFIGNGSERRSLPDSATKHDSGLQSILIFTNLGINDFGFYRVIAKNKFPISATEVFQLIPAVPDTSPSLISAIAGGVAAGVVAILLVGIGIILWRRHQNNKTNLDGLADNPVYDSSDVRPGPLAEYATPDKSKKKAYHKEDPTKLYAHVNKTRKTKSGQKREMYENDTRFGRSSNNENVFENQEAEASRENVSKNPGAASTGTLVRKDGLLYADVMLDPPTTKNGKPFIRGLENQTEYADIAYGKRGEPLPDNDEEKEHGSSNN